MEKLNQFQERIKNLTKEEIKKCFDEMINGMVRCLNILVAMVQFLIFQLSKLIYEFGE